MATNNKKRAFSLIELVIVIAVIAILAAVLIPTFSGVIGKSEKSAGLSDCKNILAEITTIYAAANYTVPDRTIFEAKVKDKTVYYVLNGNNLEPTETPDLANRVALEVQGVKVWERSGTVIAGDGNITVKAGRPVSGTYTLRVNDADGREIYADSGASADTALSFRLWNSADAKLDEAYRTKTSATEAAGWYTYYLQIGVEYYYGIFLIK